MCIKVNRITVNVNRKYDETRISLYKTNELLGTLNEVDLDLPTFSQGGVSLKAYQAYCRDFIVELLDIGGIPGFYYEPKQENDSIKYTPSIFKNGVDGYISDLIGDKYEYKLLMTERVDIKESYKDGYIKNATGEFDIRLEQFDIKICILSEIKSGQLCRPKIMKYGENEYSFNITNIGRIIKSTQ